jgi:opacity protein-like surface antigen
MKKMLITSFLMLVFASGFSQGEELLTEKKTQFGITGGFNQDFFASSPYSFNGLNFYVGFFGEYKISEKFRLQIEMLYKSTQGSGYNTLQFPLLLKYEISDRFRIFGGAQVNWSFEDLYIDPVYDDKPGDFALSIGVEYDLSEKWYLTARYVHGFKKFPSASGRRAREGAFLVGVGYRF